MRQYLLSEIHDVVQFLSKECFNQSILIFNGEMGAGKTTLIKALCHHWKVEDVVNSPTFSIVNEYITTSKETIYHFDFYRIKDEYEAQDIGVDAYFYSGEKCLIEWASKVPNLIPTNHVIIDIIVIDEFSRTLQITKNGQ